MKKLQNMSKLYGLILVLVLANCQDARHGALEAQHQFTNHLVNESSPYLLSMHTTRLIGIPGGKKPWKRRRVGSS
jgi:hypothetical protein